MYPLMLYLDSSPINLSIVVPWNKLPFLIAYPGKGYNTITCPSYKPGSRLEFANRLLDHPLFPSHFGIDIFMTTVAVAEEVGIQEVLLGLKLHESTAKYIDPGTHLTCWT